MRSGCISPGSLTWAFFVVSTHGTISKITAPLHQLPDAPDHVASSTKKRVKSADKVAKKLFKAAAS
jgi:hypothetical protein